MMMMMMMMMMMESQSLMINIKYVVEDSFFLKKSL